MRESPSRASPVWAITRLVREPGGGTARADTAGHRRIGTKEAADTRLDVP